MAEYIDTGVAPNVPCEPYRIPVYGCRFYDAGVLIRDYKPCKNADGVEGMYDTIGEEFMDKDSFAKMMLEHYMRSDSIRVSYGGSGDAKTKSIY